MTLSGDKAKATHTSGKQATTLNYSQQATTLRTASGHVCARSGMQAATHPSLYHDFMLCMEAIECKVTLDDSLAELSAPTTYSTNHSSVARTLAVS